MTCLKWHCLTGHEKVWSDIVLTGHDEVWSVWSESWLSMVKYEVSKVTFSWLGMVRYEVSEVTLLWLSSLLFVYLLIKFQHVYYLNFPGFFLWTVHPLEASSLLFSNSFSQFLLFKLSFSIIFSLMMTN